MMLRLLIDMCVASKRLTAELQQMGHDVLIASAIDPRASDSRLLSIALSENRIIVTADKDFGELVFVQGQAHGPIVRLVDLSVEEHVMAMNELLAQRSEELTGSILVTVSRGRIRIRRQN